MTGGPSGGGEMATERNSTIQERIKLLEDFKAALERVFNGTGGKDLRTYINKNLVAVRAAVREAGTLNTVTVSPPPAIGGLVMRDVNPFDNIFNDLWGMSLIPTAIASVEQAIGFFEYALKDPELLMREVREAIDIETAVERALRPSFRSEPPGSEEEVQDAVENILNALGIEFTRERETAVVGPRGFIPDFAIPTLDLVIEVKLATPKHSAAEIQEELAADIAAYSTKWRRLLAVVYDLGVIADPYRFRHDNQQHFGVSVVVVKH